MFLIIRETRNRTESKGGSRRARGWGKLNASGGPARSAETRGRESRGFPPRRPRVLSRRSPRSTGPGGVRPIPRGELARASGNSLSREGGTRGPRAPHAPSDGDGDGYQSAVSREVSV